MPSPSRPRRSRRPASCPRRSTARPAPASGWPARVLESRESADPPRAATSIPIARLHADRSVELLPDAPSTDPNLILVDVGDGGPPTAAPRGPPCRRDRPPRSSVPRGGAVESIRGRFRAPEQTTAPLRRDPRRPGRRLGGLLRARRRADAPRRGLVRHHAADRRLAAGRHPGRRRQRRAARLRDLPEPGRRGHRGRRLRVHHRRAHPLAAPPDARSPDGPGEHPRPRHRRRAGLDRLSGRPRDRRARRPGRGRRGQRRRPVRLADAGRRDPGVHRRRPPPRGARGAPSRDRAGHRRGDQRRPGQPVGRAQRADGTTGPARRRPAVRPGVRDARPAGLPDPVHPQRVAPRGAGVRRGRGPVRGDRHRPRRRPADDPLRAAAGAAGLTAGGPARVLARCARCAPRPRGRRPGFRGRPLGLPRGRGDGSRARRSSWPPPAPASGTCFSSPRPRSSRRPFPQPRRTRRPRRGASARSAATHRSGASARGRHRSGRGRR